MADPKYANLPGIAIDQPDLYETDDLPESDQHLDFDVEETDAVETLHISATEAFGKFKGKQLETSSVDFSDRIRRSKQKGYIAWTGDYELAGKDEDETVEQRYQRLNCEIGQLLDDLDKMKESGKEKAGSHSLIGLVQMTARLQDQLAGMKLEDALGSDGVLDLQDPSGSMKNKLITQLEILKTEPQKNTLQQNSSGKSSEDSNTDDVMYELRMKPESSKLDERQRLANFEKRLEGLEKVLGPSQDKVSVLSMETNTKNVTSAVSILNSKLCLLEPNHLDHIEGRLAALLQKLNTVSEKKTALEEAEKNNKIAELYDMVTSNQPMAASLPDIVDRLESLQALHDQALNFNRTLVELDSYQQKLESNLSGNQKALEDTKEKFTENIQTIQKNFELMDQRLSKLKK